VGVFRRCACRGVGGVECGDDRWKKVGVWGSEGWKGRRVSGVVGEG